MFQLVLLVELPRTGLVVRYIMVTVSAEFAPLSLRHFRTVGSA